MRLTLRLSANWWIYSLFASTYTTTAAAATTAAPPTTATTTTAMGINRKLKCNIQYSWGAT